MGIEVPFEHEVIQQELQSNIKLIKKVTPTLARRIKQEEIGTTLVTYVLGSDGSIKAEMEKVLEEGMYVLRNSRPLNQGTTSKQVFNERYSSEDDMQYNFWSTPGTTEFEPLVKRSLIEAIIVSQDLWQALGLSDAVSAYITKQGRTFPMAFEIGDFITKSWTILNRAAFEQDYTFAPA